MNLKLFYSDPSIATNEQVMDGLYACISKLILSPEIQDQVTVGLVKYENAEGVFGNPLAIRHRNSKAPDVNNLQTFNSILILIYFEIIFSNL